MTQTQTTAERIIGAMVKAVEFDERGSYLGYDFNPAAEQIAAEIDALTAERDAARATIAANNAKSEAWEAEAEAQLAEARAEIKRIMAIADQERVAYRSDVETERQKADQQLAEARAEIGKLKGDTSGPFLSGLVSRRRHDQTVRELAEARAEAERLRLPAEAWETAEAANVANAKRMGLIMDAHAYGLAKDIWVAAQEQAAAAAVRAREAAKGKP